MKRGSSRAPRSSSAATSLAGTAWSISTGRMAGAGRRSLTGGGAESGGAHIERDRPDTRIDRRPQAANAVGVVRHHPVAHELRRHRNDHAVAVDVGQIERLQPRRIGGVADLRTQQAAHLGPLMLDIGCLRKDHSHLRPRLPAVSGVSSGASSREAPRLRWMPRGRAAELPATTTFPSFARTGVRSLFQLRDDRTLFWPSLSIRGARPAIDWTTSITDLVEMLSGKTDGVRAKTNRGLSGWQEDRRVNVHFCAMVEKPATPLRHHWAPSHEKRRSRLRPAR